jgi:hypothetical protein
MFLCFAYNIVAEMQRPSLLGLGIPVHLLLIQNQMAIAARLVEEE